MKREKTGGRVQGSLNRTTGEIRTLITAFIDANIDTLQGDFETLEPKDRLAFFEKLLPYVIAKQKEVVEVSKEPVTGNSVNIISMVEYVKMLEAQNNAENQND